jgi:hypothetical protein
MVSYGAARALEQRPDANHTRRAPRRPRAVPWRTAEVRRHICACVQLVKHLCARLRSLPAGVCTDCMASAASLEHVYASSKFVQQICIFCRRFSGALVAVVVPDPEALYRWAVENLPGFQDGSTDLCVSSLTEGVSREKSQHDSFTPAVVQIQRPVRRSWTTSLSSATMPR